MAGGGGGGGGKSFLYVCMCVCGRRREDCGDEGECIK